uniref:Uncharacterized protein n=1 Tax=Candidatus Kentrum sp. MB TaxID=2138164 RepID=A0A450XSQ1_9GAMM|nr:MAG: hypothetical protein BECKMB1821G_GA0114241_11076 [Candidatus Kentron sp. MB]VFK35282.1 MAG: hypothetical protein BECKMB1821I_GA0114274_11096 [Candidatus Kentron sp. MB]VFK77181.1 MAG: hypothetical protein BECKMB1821H_GA0114242_11076 [Candidatus Kentron sp. MB]
MKRLEKTLNEFLNKMGHSGGVPLGGKKKPNAQPSDKDAKDLLERLRKDAKFTNRILILYIAALCIMYATGVFLIFYLTDSPHPQVVAGTIGGISFGLMAVIERLHGMWQEKARLDVIMTLLQGLPATEAVSAIASIYWGIFRH